MSTRWRALPWDTEFFGLPIGRIELDGAEPADLAEAEAEARAAGIRCLYGYLDPVDHRAGYWVQDLGYRLVETSALFDAAPGIDVALPAGEAVVRPGDEGDLPALEGAVDRLAPWSRYAVDDRFGLDAARRMNRAWLERAAGRASEDHVLLVAETAGVVTGFLSLSRDPSPMIDTMATTAPGSGTMGALVAAGRTWAGPPGLRAGWVAARNVASYRFLESCGFRVAEVRYVFHRWLDDGPAS